VFPREIVVDPQAFGQHCRSGFAVEDPHHFEPFFLGPMKPFDSVDTLLRANARDPLVGVEPTDSSNRQLRQRMAGP
jgi:hypothetical protein